MFSGGGWRICGNVASLERHMEEGLVPLCDPCYAALKASGANGRKLKATGERWWIGHGVGSFPSKQFPPVE